MDYKQRVREVFSTLFKNEGIDFADNQLNAKFSDTDSLLYMKFIIALEEEFQVEINDASLMKQDYKSLDDIAAILSKMDKK